MSQRGSHRELTEKEKALIRSHRDRQARYMRTAIFVQSKWFILIGGGAVAIFLLIVFIFG